MSRRLLRACVAAGLFAVLAAVTPPRAHAYIGGPPLSLGNMCNWSTHAMVAKIDRLDREKGVVIFRKVADLKGKWPAETIRHQYPPGLPDRQYILDWAEPGKTVVMFALESYRWGHTYIDNTWYAANTADWQTWTVSHSEPLLLRMYSGKTDRLVSAATAILAGKEVVVPGMVDGNVQDLQQRKAKLQRLRASLKLLDYNAKRDFVGMGGDEFLRLGGMPGFSAYSPLPRVGSDAQAVSLQDFDGDGKVDLCLLGPGRAVLMQNGGDYFTEFALPNGVGGRAAVWADYNGDGKPDLFVATATGPKLFTNLGGGNFRDDSGSLPRESAYNLTAAAWLDYDGDGWPDLLLGNGFHGLRLYRNLGQPHPQPAPPPVPGKPPLPPPPPLWFEDVSAKVGLGPDGLGGTVKGDALVVCDVNGDGRPDFLYAADDGLLVLNTPQGFQEAKNSGIAFKSGGVGPVFCDYDGDGKPDLFVPQQEGPCKLFRNEGGGRFSDVTDRAGDLSRSLGHAVCAAWGDFDNDGRPDLFVGCLRGSNRFLRNRGDGTFEDRSDEIGLTQRVFNTQGIALADLNNDGVLDVVLNNEGQESAVLLGNPDFVASKKTPLTLHVGGSAGVVGGVVRVLDRAGVVQAEQVISGGDGRGGQSSPQVRFALNPGTYKVEVRYSSGLRRAREVPIAAAAARGVIDDQTPRVE